MRQPMRIAFVAPAYWPAEAFGGPIWVLRALAAELVERGNLVDVWTTSLQTIERGRSWRTRSAVVDGATVHYLATPIRYRWMGFAPTLRAELARAPRPDVAHVFGFRDPIGVDASLWFRRHRIPYAFEALGMFAAKLRKVRLKHLLDRSIVASVPRHAAVVVAASEIERREYLAGGIGPERIVVRPNGVPEVPSTPSGALRRHIGIDAEPLVLYVGRVADGKGVDLLVEALPRLDGAHLAVVGPDDGHGTTKRLEERARRLTVERRVHFVGQWRERPLGLYADADVFALPSAHENFGMAAAEAAAAGVPVVTTDRCGVSELLRHHGALVVPYDAESVADALASVLDAPELRTELSRLARSRADEYRWPKLAALQESIYEGLRA